MTQPTPPVTVLEALTPPASLARVRDSNRPPLRIGVVQHAWTADAQALRAFLDAAVDAAAERAAGVVAAAVRAAQDAPMADPADAFTDVWADGGAAWRT